MKELLKILLVVSLVLGTFAIAYAIHEIIPSETQILEPGPDAAKLNVYLTRYDLYTRWNLWPGKGRLYEGTEPHGALLTTFVNETALLSIKKGEKPLPEGSMIAKENYTADKKFVALTVMYKVKGYNPEGGDWFWAKYAPNGSVEAEGKVTGCLDCHGKAKDNDYIWTDKLK